MKTRGKILLTEKGEKQLLTQNPALGPPHCITTFLSHATEDVSSMFINNQNIKTRTLILTLITTRTEDVQLFHLFVVYLNILSVAKPRQYWVTNCRTFSQKKASCVLSNDRANITITQNNDSAESNINQCQIYLVLGSGEFIFFQALSQLLLHEGTCRVFEYEWNNGIEVQQKLSILRKVPEPCYNCTRIKFVLHTMCNLNKEGWQNTAEKHWTYNITRWLCSLLYNYYHIMENYV